MKSLYKFTIIFLLIPFLAFANKKEKQQEKSKTINKSFTVNSNATLGVTNQYGNINIVTWNKNEIEIEVKITVKGRNNDKIEDQLNNITVDFDANSNNVKATTKITKRKNSWSFWSENDKINYRINYKIKMPISNNVDLNNDYGNIFIDSLEGQAKINCDYGNIIAAKLNADNNLINLDYCNDSNIGFMKSGDVNVDYSKITIENSGNLQVNADYTTTKIGRTNDIVFNADYGSVSINEAFNIKGDSDYTSLKLGMVKNSASVELDYGALRISQLSKDFKSLDIKSKYAAIKINVEEEANFDFEIDLQYSGLNGVTEKMEYFKEIKNNSKKYYQGKFGNGSTKSNLKIKSQYGGVTIKKY